MQKKNIIVDFNDSPLKSEYFGEFARWWYEQYQDRVSDTTYIGYEYTLDKLIDVFGNWKLRDIRAYHVERFLENAKECGLSKSYVAKCRAMLGQIMRKAEANGLIEKNPVLLADHISAKYPPEFQENIKDSFRADEVKSLFANLPTDNIGLSIRLMLASGIRGQELLGLERKHLEPDGSCIHVRQAVKMVRGTAIIGTPKSKTSYRDVPIPSSAREYAIALLERSPSTYLVSGRNPDQPYNPRSYRRLYFNQIDQCGVRHLPPHCCRHTYISQLQAAGVDMSTIQALVGHTDSKMTEHYLHVQLPVLTAATEKYNTVITLNAS